MCHEYKQSWAHWYLKKHVKETGCTTCPEQRIIECNRWALRLTVEYPDAPVWREKIRSLHHTINDLEHLLTEGTAHGINLQST